VLLDDLHWLDEASLSLLHFAIRELPDADVAFMATARPAELGENIACTRMLGALPREDALVELRIGPLAPATIAELAESIAPGADAEQIAKATHGNPLFALKMAKALARGDEPLSSRVDALIADRLARLDERASALVPWIAAFGRSIPPALLARLVERDSADLFEALGDLECHGILQASDDGTFDFVHDLVRSAAYKRLSPPRRAMLLARIGAVLAAMPDPDDTIAADSARHADLGEDSATCAAASARAARRCLRLLAYRDAEELVALGRGHAHRLAPEQRVRAEFELIHALLHPGVRLRDPGDLARDLTNLCAEAQRFGLDAELSGGLSLLARAYHWGWGDIPRARALLERAARLIETAHAPKLEPLLESARCLAYLEMDMTRTYRLFDDLGTLHHLAAGSVQYQWGLGLVRAWNGETDEARRALTQAIELSTGRADHWIVFECTARLALLELEAGAVDAAESLCAQLEPLATKLGKGSEMPYARAIGALHAVASGDQRSDAELDAALAELEAIDARFLIPDLLGIAAEFHYRAGRLDLAADVADRALRVASDVARPPEEARASAVLACVAATRGDLDAARAHLTAHADEASMSRHVEGWRHEAERLLHARKE
jgi:tetratricopeptide (TPR) repeat protein